jgi:hypothetical protein
VERMVKELSIHASIEENELYPLIRAQVPGGEAQVTEGLREHQEAKEVLAELDRMDGEDPNLDGKVMTLIADVRHHVEEEESEVLPKLRRSLDRTALRELGDALRKAKRTAAPPAPPSRSRPAPGQRRCRQDGRVGRPDARRPRRERVRLRSGSLRPELPDRDRAAGECLSCPDPPVECPSSERPKGDLGTWSQPSWCCC